MDCEELKKIATAGEVGPISRRFQHLLAAEGEEVFSRTLRFVMRCKSQDVSIDYQRLFDDLMQWQYYPESVRTRWARSFWAPREEEGS
jgi:CRISPR type I-E-associated protein CasB/Cse2